MSSKIREAEPDKPGKADPKISGSFYQTPLFQAATVGVPFSVFKLLFGTLMVRNADGMLIQLYLGWLIIAWSLIDLTMNLTRMIYDLLGKKSPIEYCTIAQFGRFFSSPKVFLAIDTLVSFSIISFALWSGWIKDLTTSESYLWYAATTLNLISVSLVNLWIELERRRC